MKVKKLSGETFRNLLPFSCEFCEETNVIYGNNAQGKTNLIEAIWLFTGAKSFRGAKDSEMVSFSGGTAKLKMEFISGGIENEAKISINARRSAELNTKKLKSPSGLVGSFCATVFSPVDLGIIKEGPALRRRFLDLAIGQLYPSYVNLLKEYTRALTQRNAILKDMNGVFDFYINYLRRPDFLYLYDAFTLSDNKLNKQLFDYAVQSYSGDIEAVFELLIHLNQGEKFENRKEIAEICGLGSLSIESYIFTLLKELSGSDKGLATVIKNRVKAGVELGEAIGFSSMYNFMSRSLLLFCELKMLVMSGIVYKTVRNLPDTFDEKALSRYQKYIWRLKEIPLSDLLRLRQCMGKKAWRSELDFLNFIYRYYNMKANMTLAQMQSAN